VPLAMLIGLIMTAWAWWRGSLGTVALRPHCTATAGGQSTELDPTQAGNAATIASVAVRRGLPGRAASIAIATAMQESKLYNISYGDRDSLGLFQQRPSQGWGTKAQVQDPVYSSNAFYDVLVKIEGYENLPITKAAQKVQRSAFPDAYATHEPEARALASVLTGYTAASMDCILTAPKGLVRQQVGQDGLTQRARAVATAASLETGRTGKAADGTGLTLKFTLAGREGLRLSWSLAHWAVSRANALNIVSVRTADRGWQRSDPNKGWTTDQNGPGSGVVLITVATGT
jgi:hypothetical protein